MAVEIKEYLGYKAVGGVEVPNAKKKAAPTKKKPVKKKGC